MKKSLTSITLSLESSDRSKVFKHIDTQKLDYTKSGIRASGNIAYKNIIGIVTNPDNTTKILSTKIGIDNIPNEIIEYYIEKYNNGETTITVNIEIEETISYKHNFLKKVKI